MKYSQMVKWWNGGNMEFIVRWYILIGWNVKIAPRYQLY